MSPDTERTPPVEALVEHLEETVALLRAHGEDRWAAWLERARRQIEDGDRHGVDHLLGAFGGMGSLGDLYICPQNGHTIGDDAVTATNERLARLRERIFVLARELLRDTDT